MELVTAKQPNEIIPNLLIIDNPIRTKELEIELGMGLSETSIREALEQLANVKVALIREPIAIRLRIKDELATQAVLDEPNQAAVIDRMRTLNGYFAIIKQWLENHESPVRLFITAKSSIDYQVDDKGDKITRILERCREMAGLIDCDDVDDSIEDLTIEQTFRWKVGTNRLAKVVVDHNLVNRENGINKGVVFTEDDMIEAIEKNDWLIDPEQPSSSRGGDSSSRFRFMAPDVMACGSNTKAVVGITVNGINLRALVDTGASISLGPIRLVKELAIRPQRTQLSATSASGHSIPIRAMGEANIRIGGSSTDGMISFTDDEIFGPHKKYDLILGCDTFEKLSPITFDFKNSQLIHAGVALKLQPEPVLQWEHIPVRAMEDYSIEPDSQLLIRAKVDQPSSLTQKVMLIDHMDGRLIRKNLGSVPTVVSPVRGEVNIVLTNPTKQPLTVHKNMRVAYANEIFECQDGSFMEVPMKQEVNDLDPIELNEVEVDPSFVVDFEKAVVRGPKLERLKRLCEKYHDVFSKSQYDLGSCTVGEHKIVTTTENPVASKPTRAPFKYKEELRKHIDRLSRCGVMVDSDTPWLSNIVLVVKKDGSLRPCIDFRKLNAVTVPDHYPLPRLEDILTKVGGCHYYSSLDLSSGYLQLRLEKEASRKCGVITEDKTYQMTHLPFGLKNATSAFARTMAFVLTGLEDSVIAYVDDILIFTKEDNFEKHLASLEEVLKRFRLYNLKISPKKCVLGADTMAFLGHEINKEGYHPSISKCEIIKEIPPPKTLREVRRFVGMASFFRKFIKNFAMIVEPLVKLTRKEIPFKWGDEEQLAFDEIKELLINKPILAFPDYDKPFHIVTDASNVGQGGALMQKDDEGKWVAVAYFSRTLSSTERRWAAVHVELGAIIVALREFKPFIFMADVELHCDHKPLTYLIKNAKAHPSLARWLIELNNYQITLVHIKGKQNTLADALSRLDEEKSENDIKDVKELEDIAEFPVCLSLTLGNRVVNECEGSNLMTLKTQEGETLAIKIDEEQRNDQQVAAFMDFLEKGTVPSDLTDKEQGDFLEASKNLAVESGLLYHHPEGAKRRVFVPVSLRSLLFDSFHISPLGGGHMSIKKTARKCGGNYYWPNMHRDLVFWTKCCITCQLRNKPTPRYRAEMLSTPVNTLFAKVGLDLCGPFPVSDTGSKHIMNVICWFTKYIISIPVPDGRAVTLAHALLTKVYLVYGGCTELISDNASSFTSEFFREFCSLLYVNRHFATPHWSQGNAATERTFRTYHDILAKYIGKNDRNFDEFLPFATFCYNTATHSTTNESPFFLMFGRDPIFCVDQIIDPRVRPPIGFTEEGDFKRRLVISLRLAWEAADEATKKAQLRGKQQYDKRTRELPIQEGDRVLFRDYRHKTGEARKFHSPYRGIYRVIQVDGVHVTIVSCNSPQANPLTVNINQLKPCNEWVPLGFTSKFPDLEEKNAAEKAKATEVLGKPGYSHTSASTWESKNDENQEVTPQLVYKNLRGRQVLRTEQ
jgi:hypothetical protein